MTDRNLSELLTRLDAEATPGPWEVTYSEGYDHLNGYQRVYGFVPVEGSFDDDEADAELTVALRNHVPELLAALAERDQLRFDLDQAEAFGIGEFRATEWAYTQATKTIEKHRNRAEKAEAERDQLRATVARVEEAVANGPCGGCADAHDGECSTWQDIRAALARDDGGDQG